MQVLQVLYGGERARRHIGAVLQIAGVDRCRRWLVVALVESDTNDRYTVVSARRLDDADRMSHELTERLFAEAERCGTTPSELIRQAVEARLDVGRPSQVVTVDVATLHHAIDQAVRRAA